MAATGRQVTKDAARVGEGNDGPPIDTLQHGGEAARVTRWLAAAARAECCGTNMSDNLVARRAARWPRAARKPPSICAGDPPARLARAGRSWNAGPRRTGPRGCRAAPWSGHKLTGASFLGRRGFRTPENAAAGLSDKIGAGRQANGARSAGGGTIRGGWCGGACARRRANVAVKSPQRIIRQHNGLTPKRLPRALTTLAAGARAHFATWLFCLAS